MRRRGQKKTKTDMALIMKDKCEECGKELSFTTNAYICSYECTFCPECTEKMKYICKNCKGELVKRPKRKKAS
jgi:hypothetical protein